MRKSKRYEAPPAAVDKYREFHRFDPKDVGPMPNLRMPPRLRLAGDAKAVLYRSKKVDPSTLKRPKKSVDYIHDHDAGVKIYLPDGVPDTDIHRSARDATALVRLGKCLGYDFVDRRYPDDDVIQGLAQEPFPDLFCTPDGKCLLVIQDHRQLLAAMWGGGLGVYARGIDG